jgi:amino acid transporter
MAYGVYLANYADGGADGLSNFFSLAIVLILSFGSSVGFFTTLFLLRGTSRSQKILVTMAALLVILVFLVSIGIFGYYTSDFEPEFLEQVE